MAKKIDLNGLDHFKEKENAMIAAEYSSSKTYAVGEYAYHAGTLYKCTTAITTAEAWTSGHWAAAKLAEDVTAQSEAITQLSQETVIVNKQETQLYGTSGSTVVGVPFDDVVSGGYYGNEGKWNELAVYLTAYINPVEYDYTVYFDSGSFAFLRIFNGVPSQNTFIEGFRSLDNNLPTSENPYTVKAGRTVAICWTNSTGFGMYATNKLVSEFSGLLAEELEEIDRFGFINKDRKILWIGDSVSQLRELPSIVAENLNITICDSTFAGAPLTYGQSMYQPTGFMELAGMIADGDFTDLSTAITAQQNAGINVTEKLQHLAMLQDLDFSTITDVVIFAGTNDFDNEYVNATNFVSGFTSGLTDLLTAYPSLMVYVFSPTWRGDKTTGMETIPTMPDLVNLEKQVAESFNLPFYDLYHKSGINSLTASVYLENDLLHPSASGDELLANKCSKFIISN